MRRGEFINSMGAGVLLVCSGSCMLAGCSSGDESPTVNPPGNGGGPTMVSIATSSIAAIGDQTKKSSILFFRIGSGNTPSDFVATEAVCPHQGGSLVWEQNNGIIECQLHFAQYTQNGAIVQGPQNTTGNTRELKVYPITISGDTLTATLS